MAASLSSNQEVASFKAAAIMVLDRIAPDLVNSIRAADDAREAFWANHNPHDPMPRDSESRGNGSVETIEVDTTKE